MNMSKLSITESVKIIPVSESTLRRDLKNGKVSFELDPKGRKLIDVSELQRVYEYLNNQNGSHPADNNTDESAEPVNDNHQNLSMNGNDTHHNPSITDNDSQKIIELLEGQVQDLKDQLDKADSEKAQLLSLADRLQKQNELLMLPNPKKRPPIWNYFRIKR